jgi:hypothetical protein
VNAQRQRATAGRKRRERREKERNNKKEPPHQNTFSNRKVSKE